MRERQRMKREREREREGTEGKARREKLAREEKAVERRCVPSVFRGKRADYNKCIKTRKSGSVVVVVVVLVVNF